MRRKSKRRTLKSSRRKRKTPLRKPKNMTLYNHVKAEAKKKFKVWPSAYGSGWLSKEYTRRGGTYTGSRKSSRSGLGRWFREKWINVCRLPKKVACGRPKTSASTWKKKYPYCRPSIKVTNSTPQTASKLSKTEIKRRCSQKRRNPLKRVRSKRQRKRSRSRRR